MQNIIDGIFNFVNLITMIAKQADDLGNIFTAAFPLPHLIGMVVAVITVFKIISKLAKKHSCLL